MEKLFSLLKGKVDQSEIYNHSVESTEVIYQAGKIDDIKFRHQRGISLRVFKDDQMGFAFTRNLVNPGNLIDSSMLSLKSGLKTKMSLPQNNRVESICHDDELRKLTNEQMIQNCEQILEYLRGKSSSETMVYTKKNNEDIRVENSVGSSCLMQKTNVIVELSLRYPGSFVGVNRAFDYRQLKNNFKSEIDKLLELFIQTEKSVKIKAGSQKVLFTPRCVYLFYNRFSSALSGKSIYEKVSPLQGKIGQKILSDKITLIDDPNASEFSSGRVFDDEGVLRKKLKLFDQGELKNYFYDLHYAQQMNVTSTGSGFRYGNDPVTARPNPVIKDYSIEVGEHSFEEMVGMIDRGIILDGAMGAHSGNIPNGDFSVGVCPAYYVENGEIKGQVKDAMVSGNIYEVLNRVIAVENQRSYDGSSCWTPSILCEGVNVSV